MPSEYKEQQQRETLEENAMHTLIKVFFAALWFSYIPKSHAKELSGEVNFSGSTCLLNPLGVGKDDTDQVVAAIKRCGHYGRTVFSPGQYNITRKMTWDLRSARVELRGYLNFPPNIDYWLKSENTYRVVFIQNQASWFVITGSDFEIDAYNQGGIQGNGQAWWSYFFERTQLDGDGRPLSLTLFKVVRGVIKNFRIISPPFWAGAVVQSQHVVYDGMYINATNTDPKYFGNGENVVWHTDGINTYRADNIKFLNWDVTSGDDCLALKGNSTNIYARNITCHGGTGIAIGSVGQYLDLVEIVSDVYMEDLRIRRLDPVVQPIMNNGVYFKAWSGSVNGAPPTGGGGGKAIVKNLVFKDVVVTGATMPVYIRSYNASNGDLPSRVGFANMSFINWVGSGSTKDVVDLECSSSIEAGCHNIQFQNFRVLPPAGETKVYTCNNVKDKIEVKGLDAPCLPRLPGE